MSAGNAPRIACFATQGSGSRDEARIATLLADLEPLVLPFDHSHKLASVVAILRAVRRRRPAVLVMEGTGLAGGLALLLARVLFGVRYVVSSGDAPGPFLGEHVNRWLTAPAWLYELVLCRAASGFIGWTPYLTGRALTLGCCRAMTAAGFAPASTSTRSRAEIRDQLGIADDALVVGIAGSLVWNPRRGYCYGWELVAAMRGVRRRDVVVVVVGDGSGLEHLRALAGEDLGRRVLLPGRVERGLVASYLAAMDAGSLPQSVDQIGSFRYTTKLPEYAQAGLPVITGEIPVAYDLLDGWCWRLPGESPWDRRYVAALTDLLERLEPSEIAARRAHVPRDAQLFSESDQCRRVAAFVRDVAA